MVINTIKHKINWNRKVVVYRRTRKDTSNSSRYFFPDFSRKIDFSTPIATFFPAEFPIEEWLDVKDFENWCENNLPDLDGIYYFFIRERIVLGKRKRKKRLLFFPQKKRRGRPPFSRKKLQRLGIRGRPRQRVMGCWNCVAKIEMEHGEIVKVWEHKSPRKYAPYNSPKYELLRQIEKNRELSQ